MYIQRHPIQQDRQQRVLLASNVKKKTRLSVLPISHSDNKFFRRDPRVNQADTTKIFTASCSEQEPNMSVTSQTNSF